jgi:hypothetical protein
VLCKYFIVGVHLDEVKVHHAQVKYLNYAVWFYVWTDGKIHAKYIKYPGFMYSYATLFHVFLNPELSTGKRGASLIADQQLMSSALRHTVQH